MSIVMVTYIFFRLWTERIGRDFFYRDSQGFDIKNDVF